VHVRIVATALAVAALWGCASKSAATPKAAAPAPAAAPANPNRIIILNYKFDPKTLTVAPGTTVTWYNEDIAPHTATHRSYGDESFDSGSLGHERTFTHTFHTPGSYDYLCIFHQGMQGTIIVK